ncbi:MAG: homocysteine S-methyltransferase family protein [Chthonomonadales bacterium]
MPNVIEELAAERPVLTDGAWGTQLQARGLPIGACPDVWNLHHPDRVEEVARAYVAAGSRVILTNTFGASSIALARHGLADKAHAINRAGVEISRRAAAGAARVFASMGPTGKMLAMGEVSPQEVRASFLQQAQAMAEAGADAVVVETMTDLEEARLAVSAAVEVGLPVVACMVFDAGRNKDRTMMGVTPEQAVEALLQSGATSVGANCGVGARDMLEVCRRIRAASSAPCWIKPNAGLPVLVDGKAVYQTGPTEFAEAALLLVEGGADFIGGCCGTGPEFIAALAKMLR